MKKLLIILLFIPLIFACSKDDNSLTQGNNNSNRKKLSTLVKATPCINCEFENRIYTYTNNKLTYIDVDGFGMTYEDGSAEYEWEYFIAFEHSPNTVTINESGDKTILNIDTDGKVIDDNFIFNNGYLQEIEGDIYNWSNGNLTSIQSYSYDGTLQPIEIEYSDFDDLSGHLGLSIAMDGYLDYAYYTYFNILGLLGKSTTKLPSKRTLIDEDNVSVDEFTYVFDEDNYPIKVITTHSSYENNILLYENTQQTELTYID